MMMMAFENNSKRPGQELMITSKEPKQRRVEFSDEVTLYSGSKDIDDDKKFSMEMYRRFVRSALNDLEKVCFLSTRFFQSF